MKEIIVTSFSVGKAKRRVFNQKDYKLLDYDYLLGEIMKLGSVVEEISIKYK